MKEEFRFIYEWKHPNKFFKMGLKEKRALRKAAFQQMNYQFQKGKFEGDLYYIWPHKNASEDRVYTGKWHLKKFNYES